MGNIEGEEIGYGVRCFENRLGILEFGEKNLLHLLKLFFFFAQQLILIEKKEDPLASLPVGYGKSIIYNMPV